MSKKKNKKPNRYHVQVNTGNLPAGRTKELLDSIKSELKQQYPDDSFIVTRDNVYISRLPWKRFWSSPQAGVNHAKC